MKWAGIVRTVLLGAALLAVPGGGEAQGWPLWHTLEGGAYETGFRRVWSEDGSRVWPRSGAIDSVSGPVSRPVRVDVWYPAVTCAGGARMRVRDYLEMDAPAARYDDLVFLTHRWNEYSYRGLAGDSASFDRLMASGTAACADARPSPGRFPLVVYSAGWFNRSPDNTVLAEYLASHGFVVAALPQVNPGLWTWDFRSEAHAVENQIRDMEVAIAVLRDADGVDRRGIAALGYSTGGDVALLLQGRNPLIDAVVGMDASWSLGPGNDVAESDFFRPESHDVPVLVARRPVEDGAAADAVLSTLTAAPRIVVEIAGGDHGTFSDDPVERLLLGSGPASHADTHAAMARVILEFLNRTLRGNDPFDGDGLAREFTAQGHRARFLPGKPIDTGG